MLDSSPELPFYTSSSRRPFSPPLLKVGLYINVFGYFEANMGSLQLAVAIAAEEEVKAKAGSTSPALVMNGAAAAAMSTTAGNLEVYNGGGRGNGSASEMRREVVNSPRKRK